MDDLDTEFEEAARRLNADALFCQYHDGWLRFVWLSRMGSYYWDLRVTDDALAGTLRSMGQQACSRQCRMTWYQAAVLTRVLRMAYRWAQTQQAGALQDRRRSCIPRTQRGRRHA